MVDERTVVAADGTAIAFQVVEGPGEAPVLLLLAGQSNNHHWWDLVRPDFDAFTTVTMDWRGTGSTPLGPERLSTRLLSEDALHVVDAVGASQVFVYGTSMGGRVAQLLASAHPDRVARLVLGCTSPGVRMGHERGREVRRRLSDPDRARRMEGLVDLMYSPSYRVHHPGPYGTLGDPAATPAALQQHVKASNAHDSWDVLPLIAMPTLVLHGSDDEFSPVANVQVLTSRIPDSRGVVFPGARHAYFEEAKPESSDVVVRFLLEG